MRFALLSSSLLGLAALALAGCGDGGAAVSSAQASGADAGMLVTATGCPAPGPQAGCVTMTAKGVVYDVSAAGIDMGKGVNVSLTGRSRGEAGQCGAKLTDIKFAYTQLTCGIPAGFEAAPPQKP